MVGAVKLGRTAGKSWLVVLAALCALGLWTLAARLSGDSSGVGAPAASTLRTGPKLPATASRGVTAGSWASIPLAARGPISAALGRDEAAFHLHGFSASNPAQGLDAHFGAGAVSVRSGGLRFAVGFAGVGRGGRLASGGAVVAPVRSGQQVIYRHGGLTEAWNNGPAGMEQSFTVARRPVGAAPLQLALRVSGGELRLTGGTGADARSGGPSVTISGDGQTLSYDGLLATDARGHTLQAWLSTSASRIVIHVDDRHAVYPIRIDPFVQQTEITGSDATTDTDFGYSVAISGDTIVVGTPRMTEGGHAFQGAVYVFSEPASGWANATQTAELTASDGAASDYLGWSVAISGQTIVAGAPYRTIGGNTYQGAIYVFSEPASGWANATQTAELTASDGAASDYLGWSVAISGQTITAGAPNHATGGNTYQGAVYVFSEPASGWVNATQTAELTASDGAANDSLGFSVAISGQTIVAGTPYRTIGGHTYRGAVYVFGEPAPGWVNATQTAELTASDGTASDYLGWSVAVSGQTIVAGAPYRTIGGNSYRGAVYVFGEPASGWVNATQTAELTASDGTTGDELGYSVAISGQTITAGAPNHATDGHTYQGAVYVFNKPASGWVNATQTAELTASDGTASDSLGYSVAISGQTVLTSAPDHAVGSSARQGVAYLFTEPATSALAGSLKGGGVNTSRITVARGSAVTASGSLSGVDAAAATGSVTYRVYSDRGCTHLVSSGAAETITSPGALPPSRTVSISRLGTYYWQISYSGDQTNIAAKSACGALTENVIAPTGRATITISKGTVTGTALTLPVRCSTAGLCALKFTLTYRKLTVGSASLTLRPGKSTKLKLTLNATGRRLLRAHSPLRTTLTVTQAGRKILTTTVAFRSA